VSYNLVIKLGGLVIRELAVGTKVSGLKRGRGQWNFKDDKIRSMTFFGEVKPSGACSKVVRHFEESTERERDTWQNPRTFLAKLLLLYHYVALLVIARELW
jgi:hypothetical protein